jgi:hypothetical protein
MQESCDIKKTEIKSLDIKDDLERFAKGYDINPKDLDYDISKIYFYERVKKDNKYKYNPIVFNYKENYNNSIIQRYQIRIKSGKESYFKQCVTLKVYENNMKASIVINNFSFRSPENTSKELKDIFMDINKIKAENKVLVKVFADELKHEIIEFIKHAQQTKTVNNYEIVIFDSTKNQRANRGYRVDYSFKRHNSSYVIPIESGELIMNYKKPIKGINNISAFGSIIRYPEGDLTRIYKYSTADINIKEDKESISLFSKVNGFVMLVDDELKIQNVVQTKSLIGQASNIISSKQHKIELDIVASNEDNIAVEDIVLEANNINIVGDIGKNVRIKSTKVIQDGKVSEDTIIESSFFSTKEFNGKFEGTVFRSEVAQDCEILADRIHIEKVSGGFVKGKKIEVNHLLHEVKVSVCEKFSANDITGKNSFYIQVDPQTQEKININKRNIATVDNNIELKTKEMQEIDSFIKSNKDNIKKISTYIAKSKRDGIEYSHAMDNKVMSFNKRIKRLQLINEHIKVLINTKIKLVNEIERLRFELPDVQFGCENGWGGEGNNKQKLFVDLGDDTHVFELDNDTPNAFDSRFIKRQLQKLKKAS